MPRYFFDTEDETRTSRDEVGVELRDDRAAADEARVAMAELARDFIPNKAPLKSLTMRVRDERGEGVLRLTLTFDVQRLSPT